MIDVLLDLREAEVERVGRDRRFVLQVPRFEIASGECIALVAPSGRGKSTLINLLALATPPTRAGRFTLGNHDVAGLWGAGDHDGLAALRGAAFGYVVQSGALLASLTVRENIALGQRVARRCDEDLLRSVAARLGIEALLPERPRDLSVGERQRVAIARAVAHRPVIVLADEPTAALDPANKAVVMELLLDLREQFGFALLIASHDIETLDRFGIDRVEPVIALAGRETCSTFMRLTAPPQA